MINDNEAENKKKEKEKRINEQKKVIKKFVDENEDLEKMGNKIGAGSFGLVVEMKVKDDNKIYAAKLIEKNKKKLDESELILKFRGPNIVKVTKIYHNYYNDKNYSLILMENAPLKDLNNFIKDLRENKILELIFKNPFEIIGDNLIRYFVKQIMKAFETLYLGSFTHSDFKPENLLIFENLTIKLSDFGFLINPCKIKNKLNRVKIPGFTYEYIPPEIYYNNDNSISVDEAIKFDYFTLGATIYFIKYGKVMLKYPKYKDFISRADDMIKLIERATDKIKLTKSNDKEFKEFLINLINYKPEDRSSFEDIYRNKWLNKNWDQILEIKENNLSDFKKLIIELDKSSFLFEKNKYINEQRKQIGIITINDIHNNNLKYKGNKDNVNNSKIKEKNKNKIHYHKFKLKLL